MVLEPRHLRCCFVVFAFAFAIASAVAFANNMSCSPVKISSRGRGNHELVVNVSVALPLCSSTDPQKTIINYGNDNIVCDDGNNKGDNEEEAENEDEGDNDEEAEEDDDNVQSRDKNEQSDEDDSDDENGDEDDNEGEDEDCDDIDDDDYVGELYDDNESDDDSLKGWNCVPSAHYIKNWELEWKRTKDKARRVASNAVNKGESSIVFYTTFTGVCNLTLCTMSEVEHYSLSIGHSFPTKDHVLLRIADQDQAQRFSPDSCLLGQP